LQRLLTCSYSGKVLAVRRVTENNGKKTAGVDRIIWDTPEEKTKAVHDLKRRGYQPLPLRRVYIPKKSDRKTKRPLGIPTMFDRAQQALHLLALDPVVETTADKNRIHQAGRGFASVLMPLVQHAGADAASDSTLGALRRNGFRTGDSLLAPRPEKVPVGH
jgi:hypothetical protein